MGLKLLKRFDEKCIFLMLKPIYKNIYDIHRLLTQLGVKVVFYYLFTLLCFLINPKKDEYLEISVVLLFIF